MELTNEYSFAQPHLAEDEEVLWMGRPGKGNLFSITDLLVIPFSLAFSAISVYAFWDVVSAGTTFLVGSICFLFACCCLYLAFGRFLHVLAQRRRTYYVITDRKVIRKKGILVDMLYGEYMPPIQLFPHRNNMGTIRFAPSHSSARACAILPINNVGVLFLDNVPDYEKVRGLVENIKQQAEV